MENHTQISWTSSDPEPDAPVPDNGIWPMAAGVAILVPAICLAYPHTNLAATIRLICLGSVAGGLLILESLLEACTKCKTGVK